MFADSEIEIVHLRILIVVVIVLGYVMSFEQTDGKSVKETVFKGQAQIAVEIGREDTLVVSVEEYGELAVDKVVINKATFEQLLACPGIGHITAQLIIQERSHRPFYDWRDFQDRVSGIGEFRVEELKNAGVRLNN